MNNKFSKENTTLIKLDLWSFAKIILILAVLWILFVIRDIIFIVLVAGLLATVINPIVNFFEKKKVPRWMGAMFIYLGIILILFLIGMAVVPTVISQGKILTDNIPEILESLMLKLENIFHFNSESKISNMISDWISKNPLNTGSFFSILGNVAGQIFSGVMIMVIAFYLSVRKKSLYKFFNSLIPEKYQEFVKNFFESVQKEIGAWARGLLILMLFVGTLAYLGLLLLGVKFSLTLAIVAGVTEMIPYIGPWIGGLIAVLIALTQSPALALFVGILFFIIQQIEGAFITPYVMHRSVGLDPLVIILALLVGGKLAGPVGMILAVPTVTIISIVIRYYSKYKEKFLEN